MGRHQRPNLPGAIFHATARTLHRERLFMPDVRTGALADLADAVPQSGCRILAVAVMSNHLHLVFQQGPRPPAALMQPFLRRLARRTQMAHDREGPIFWRHYGAVACLDPWHARNAIVYTHLNPVRAGIGSQASDYPWTSHGLYADPAPAGGLSRRRRVATRTGPARARPVSGDRRLGAARSPARRLGRVVMVGVPQSPVPPARVHGAAKLPGALVARARYDGDRAGHARDRGTRRRP